MKTKIFISLLILVLVVLAGGVFIYERSTHKTVEQPKITSGVDDLNDSLAKQKLLQKFSSPEEIRKFFASLPANGANGVAMDQARTLAAPVAIDSKASAEATGLGSGGNNFSTTNVQVAGVDESDITKTDGQFIYLTNNREVDIVKAVPATEANIVSTIKLAGQVQEIYLKDKYLVVFGWSDAPATASNFIRPYNYTYLNIYDVTDPKSPQLIKDFKFEGGYQSSRLIDNRLYFITTTYNFYPVTDAVLPRVLLKDQTISADKTTDQYTYPEVFYVSGSDNYNATTVSLISLDKLDQALYSQVYFMPGSENVYASRDNLYLTYTKYISDYQLRMAVAKDLLFDRLSDNEKNKINAINNIDSSILSAEEKAIKINQVIDGYFARLSDDEREALGKQLDEEFNQRYQAIYKELEKTVIHKIKLNDTALTYLGSGEVSGHLLNQYSMDEDNGYFRLATTRGQSWIMPFVSLRKEIAPTTPSQESYNNLYVLDENLQVVGSQENFGQGERIYAVRFMGKRGYVVTFKQTDPLFVFDLTNPNQPTLAGEIKLPGFSSYLHPYGENMLIGVGKEATTDKDGRTTVTGIKLSLFDVSDAAKPQELSTFKLGGPGSDTSVNYDYKAFLLIPDKNSLVVPMSLTKPNNSDYQVDFQGAVVFSLANNKLSETGRVYHKVKDTNLSYQAQIQRSLFIGDYLYTKSGVALGINKLTNLSFIKQVDLPLDNNMASGNGGSPMPVTIENVKVK